MYINAIRKLSDAASRRENENNEKQKQKEQTCRDDYEVFGRYIESISFCHGAVSFRSVEKVCTAFVLLLSGLDVGKEDGCIREKVSMQRSRATRSYGSVLSRVTFFYLVTHTPCVHG